MSRCRLRHEPGALLVVVGGLGIPSIVRVEPDGSWMCVAGTFKGRPIRSDKSVRHVCRDGDIFEDLGLRSGVANWCPWTVEINP